MITAHTIIKNEDQFIKPVLLSVISFPQITQVLIYDTGSTDKTITQIRSIKSPKIKLELKGKVNRKQLVNLRNQQIKATTTPWILLLDGDEVWPKKNLAKLIQAIKSAPKDTIALVNRTRNCVKDIYHYLPQSKGHYQIGPWQGHLNIRAIRNLSGLKVVGEYPLETYTLNSVPLQDQPQRLKFVDTWYLHTTHLKRSSSWLHELKVIDRLKKHKWISSSQPLKLKPNEVPQTLANYPH